MGLGDHRLMALVFRFFFDPGSGTCLWSASKEAEALYDYPVDHHLLPISGELKQRLDWLVQEFDTDYDWENPPGKGKWSDEQRDAFWRRVDENLAMLRRELAASEYEFRDETRR
jgi:hypothetical protein